MHMTSLPGENQASFAIAIGNESMSSPNIALDDFNLQRATDSRLHLMDGALVVNVFHARWQQRGERPNASLIKGAEDARAFGIDDPVHNRRARRRILLKLGDAQDQIAIVREGV